MSAEATYRFEFFSRHYQRTNKRVYYFRVREENGQIIVPSQGYSRRIDRDMTAGHLRGGLIEARMYDLDADGKEVM